MKLLSVLLWLLLLVMMVLFVWVQVNIILLQLYLLVKGEVCCVVMLDWFGLQLNIEEIDMDVDVVCCCVQGNVVCVLVLFKQYKVVEGSVCVDNLWIGFVLCYEQNWQVFIGICVLCQLCVSFVSVKVMQDVLGVLKVDENVQVSSIVLIYLGEVVLCCEFKGEVVVKICQFVQGLVEVYGIQLCGLYSIFDVVLNFVYGVQVGNWFRSDDMVMLFLLFLFEVLMNSIEIMGLCLCELVEVGFIIYIENVYVIFLISDGI